MNQLTKFGVRLVEELERANMSDSDLAKALGIAQPNIHTLKYKTERPRAKTVAKIAKVLKVKPEEFFKVSVNNGSTRVYLVIETGGSKQTVRIA